MLEIASLAVGILSLVLGIPSAWDWWQKRHPKKQPPPLPAVLPDSERAPNRCPDPQFWHYQIRRGREKLEDRGILSLIMDEAPVSSSSILKNIVRLHSG